jgi:hypothetical protein
VQFLLIALFQNEADMGNAALDLVLTSDSKHSWLAMMRAHNATTTMECWDPDELPNLTFSHIWSASPNFVIPWFLLGIRPLTPGYATLSIKPQPGTLTHVSYIMPTVRGPVHANVTQEFTSNGVQTRYTLSAVIPGNVRALLHAPVPPVACALRLDGNTVAASLTAKGAHLQIEVGAGVHVLAWE